MHVPRPHSALPISAASGLVALDGGLWTVADDETVLVGSGPDGRWSERIVLLPDRLPTAHDDRKRTKPDFEALAVLPDGRLWVLGSGSTSSRRRGVVVDLRTRAVGVLDLAPLFAELERACPELNIEGAVIHDGAAFLAQRGNGARGASALIRLDLEAVLAGVARGVLDARCVAEIHGVALPALEDVSLALTDLASDDRALYFSAAAEDSGSTYHDGACKGSAIGSLTTDGRLLGLAVLDGTEKIEGLSVRRSDDGTIRGWAVADPDDRARTARLLALEELRFR